MMLCLKRRKRSLERTVLNLVCSVCLVIAPFITGTTDVAFSPFPSNVVSLVRVATRVVCHPFTSVSVIRTRNAARHLQRPRKTDRMVECQVTSQWYRPRARRIVQLRWRRSSNDFFSRSPC
jgi:hypothetical protein